AARAVSNSLSETFCNKLGKLRCVDDFRDDFLLFMLMCMHHLPLHLLSISPFLRLTVLQPEYLGCNIGCHMLNCSRHLGGSLCVNFRFCFFVFVAQSPF